MQSMNNACFTAALYPSKNNVDRKSSCSHYILMLNLKDIEFPINQNKKFENLNNISINV